MATATLNKPKAKTRCNPTNQQQQYAVEEVFDRIDKKFVDFYGEYGRKIVNARREEWNEEGFVKLQTL